MSTHKRPLTEMEREGLIAHGLPTDSPSQISDAFRHGMAWAEAERDALVAHVERLHSAIHDATMLPVAVKHGSAEAEELQDLRDIIGLAAAEKPATSIASMKAQWQAEALEAHARTLISQHRCDDMFAARTIHDVLLSEAQKLRCQNEEEQ